MYGSHSRPLSESMGNAILSVPGNEFFRHVLRPSRSRDPNSPAGANDSDLSKDVTDYLGYPDLAARANSRERYRQNFAALAESLKLLGFNNDRNKTLVMTRVIYTPSNYMQPFQGCISLLSSYLW